MKSNKLVSIETLHSDANNTGNALAALIKSKNSAPSQLLLNGEISKIAAERRGGGK